VDECRGDAEWNAHKRTGNSVEWPDRIHAGIADLVRIHPHAHFSGRPAQLLAQHQGAGDRRLIEGAYRKRLERHAQNRPVLAERSNEIAIEIDPGECAGEAGFALKSVWRRH